MAETRDVVRLSPRISPRLIAQVERLDDERVPIAEVYRRLGEAADRLELTRPSYERVRQLVRDARRRRRFAGPTTTAVLADVVLRVRPPDALGEHLAGVELPRRPSR
jgi:hypothetical protein